MDLPIDLTKSIDFIDLPFSLLTLPPDLSLRSSPSFFFANLSRKYWDWPSHSLTKKKKKRMATAF